MPSSSPKKSYTHSKSESAVYSGWVRHRRFVPGNHEFTYPLFMLYLDLDELETTFKRHWFCSLERFNVVSFKRADYFKPEHPDLKKAVIEHVNTELNNQGIDSAEIHSVRLLTHARYFNFVFNPVSFYYCFDANNSLCAILAEITNTPWDERYSYVLPVGASGRYGHYAQKGLGHHEFKFHKDFHVSPFNPMEMDYRWVFSAPEETLRVHMDNHLIADQEKHFDATVVLEHQALASHLASTLIRFPLMTVKVSVGIYWQAFKLWIKRMPFYDHPDLQQKEILDKALNAKETAK